MKRQQQLNEAHSPSVKTTPLCPTFAVQTSLWHGSHLLQISETKTGRQCCTLNEQTGPGNPKTAVCFSQGPSTARFLSFGILSCTRGPVSWTSFNCHSVWVVSTLLLFGVHLLEELTLSPAMRLRLLPSQWQTVRKCFPLVVDLKALYIVPPHAVGWWLGTFPWFPSQPLVVGSLHWGKLTCGDLPLLQKTLRPRRATYNSEDGQ